MKAVFQLFSSVRGHVLSRAVLLVFIVGALAVLGAPPAWWASRQVTNGNAVDDYAPINQGQLKNLVKGAVQELDLHLPDGAGEDLEALVGGWATPSDWTDDYSAVNIGQIKAVAALVYDRLSIPYPWNSSPNPPDDFALANIGQAKNLFAFDLSMDTNSVGIPDWWRNKYGLSFSSPEDALVLAPGGISYLQKYQLGLNPLVADTDGDGFDDGTEIAQGLDPNDPNSVPPPLIAITKTVNVESGGDVTIQLSASGGAGGHTFSIVRSDPDIGTFGTLGSLSSGGSVTFTSNDEASYGTWFDYEVRDAVGQVASETLSIRIAVTPVIFESRGISATNNGGGYEASHVFKMSSGSWDVGGLSPTVETQNTMEPEWSGWTVGMPVKTVTGSGGYGYPYDPSASPSKAAFEAQTITEAWAAAGTPSVSSSLSWQSFPNGTTMIHAFDQTLSTAYPYSYTVFAEDGTPTVLYRLPNPPGESSTLDDYEEKNVTAGNGYVAEWQANRMEVRMVRADGSTHRVRRTLTKTRDVNGVLASEDVVFTIPENGIESNIVQLSAYAAVTGASNAMSETLDLPASLVQPQALPQQKAHIDIDYVDRDNPNANWNDQGQPKPLADPGVPLYSGKGTGDMVKFNCVRPPSAYEYLEWEASGPGGIIIQGPRGSGPEWNIFEGGVIEGGATSLRWKPGDYTISCLLIQPGKADVNITRKVRIGFRTDDFVIVGQIVPTSMHTLTAARSPIVKLDLVKDASSLNKIYTAAALYIPPYSKNTLIAATPVTALTLAWALHYSAVARVGPGRALASLDADERAFMIQTLLNAAPDAQSQRLPNAPTYLAKTAVQLEALYNSKEWRIYAQYQAKGLLGPGGVLQSMKTVSPVTPLVLRAEIGPTKSPSLDSDALFPGSPAISTGFTEPALTPADPPFNNNRINGIHTSRLSRSLHATGRVGEKGRKVHWHLLGRDAPWIHGEIEFQSKGPAEFPVAKIYTSMDMSVTSLAGSLPENNATISGANPFNNLSVFKRKVTLDDKPYERIAAMLMNGHVQPFIYSGSKTWPGRPHLSHTP